MMDTKANAILLFWSIALGLGAASAFGAYQAVNGDGSAFTDFIENLAWPGILILAGVATMVWFGWKANLD